MNEQEELDLEMDTEERDAFLAEADDDYELETTVLVEADE